MDSKFSHYQFKKFFVHKKCIYRYKMAAHESPSGSQPSSGDGETTPEEAGEHPEAETPEQPLSLSDLLG